MKLLIGVGVFLGGWLGSWAGAELTHGNYFSLASILLGGLGSVLGIFAGYKVAQNYL